MWTSTRPHGLPRPASSAAHMISKHSRDGRAGCMIAHGRVKAPYFVTVLFEILF